TRQAEAGLRLATADSPSRRLDRGNPIGGQIALRFASGSCGKTFLARTDISCRLDLGPFTGPGVERGPRCSERRRLPIPPAAPVVTSKFRFRYSASFCFHLPLCASVWPRPAFPVSC